MSKPQLPRDVKPGDLFDSKGIPIFIGDLIQTFHFRGARKKKYYLYHSVTCRDGVMRMTPTISLAKGINNGDGECYLHTLANANGILVESVVIFGIPFPEDRNRRKIASII
jgi:hypothetical protein